MHNQATHGCSSGKCFMSLGAIDQPTQQTIHVCSSSNNLGSGAMAQQAPQATDSHTSGNNPRSLGAMDQQRQPTGPVHACGSFSTSQALGGHQSGHQQEIEAMRRQQGGSPDLSLSLSPPGHHHAHIREREALRREPRENMNLLSRETIPSPSPSSKSLDLSLATGSEDWLAKGPKPVKVVAKECVLALEAVPRNNSRNSGSSSATVTGAKSKRRTEAFKGVKRPKVDPEEVDLTLRL